MTKPCAIFLKETITAYSNGAAYVIKKKLPLNNNFSKTVTAIEHMAISAKSIVTLKTLLHLLEIFINRSK